MSDVTTEEHPDAPPPAQTSKSDDVKTALRNGLRLGGSLFATWSVAIFLRFLLPRFLGPEYFGVLSFSDSFAATYFIFLGLGIETYIQKEIPVRPQHASDFMGGVLLLRVSLSAGLLMALAGTLYLTHRSAQTLQLVLIFGMAQLLISVNNTLAALMQAHGTVGRLAIANVVSKLLWGGGTMALLIVRAPLWMIAATTFGSELIKTVFIWSLVRATFKLDLRLDWKMLRMVLIASVPFYVNSVVITLNSKLDVTLLEFLTSDPVQVGWYSAAANLAGITLMLSPLLIWVVLPLLSRAAKRSREELWEIIRRAIEGIFLVTLPVILMAVLGAELWITIVFGKAYAPAAMAVRTLCPLVMLTYLAMLLSMTLVILERPWTLTIISMIGLTTNVVLTLILVPVGARLFPIGGAGVGDAAAVVVMELVVTSLLLYNIGRHVFDRHMALIVGKAMVGLGAACGVHFALRHLDSSMAQRLLRLAIDLVVYFAVTLALGAPKLGDVRAIVSAVKNRNKQSPQT